MPFLTFGLPVCIALALAICVTIGFIGFALTDDYGTVRATWDWFAVAVSVMLIASVMIVAKQYGQLWAIADAAKP